MTWHKLESGFSDKLLAMIAWLRHLFGWLVSAFRSRQDLAGVYVGGLCHGLAEVE
jgi:hypothetical protein